MRPLPTALIRVRVPLLVATALRFGLMSWTLTRTGSRVMMQGDTSSYLEPGRNLFINGNYSNGNRIEIDRTPGYPVFAMITGMLGNHVLLTIVIQILLSILSVFLVQRIADLTFQDQRFGVFAAWFFAVEPISIMYSVRVMPETLFTLLILFVIERLISYQRSGELRSVVSGGLFLAMATYVRPISYYLVPVLAIGLAAVSWRRRDLRWKAPALFLIASIPLLAVWQIRNLYEANYSGFSSIVDKNLYFYQAAGVSATIDKIPLHAEQVRLGYPDDKRYLVAHPEQTSWSQSQRLSFMRAQALLVLKAHLSRAIKSHLAGVAVVALTPCTMELLELIDFDPKVNLMPQRLMSVGIFNSVQSTIHLHPVIAVMMMVFEFYLVSLYALSVLGFTKYRKRSTKSSMVTIVGVALYFLLISGGSQAVGRYRLPIMPELCVLAGAGCASMLKRKVRLGRPHSLAFLEYNT